MAQWSTESGEQRSKQVEAAIRILMTFGVAICIIIVFVGRYIIWLLYGIEFIGAQEALVLLAPSAGTLSVFIVLSNLLNAAGRAFANIWISAGTFFIIAGTSLIFIPLFGIRGAALGALCGNSFAAVAGCVCASKYCGVDIRSCLIPNKADWSKLYVAMVSLFSFQKNGKPRVLCI
jgi:O-antigen/teichoic acid export membrane protein